MCYKADTPPPCTKTLLAQITFYIHISEISVFLIQGGGGAMFYKISPFLVDYIRKNDIIAPDSPV